MVRRSDETKGNAADGRFSSVTSVSPKGKTMVVGFNHNFTYKGAVYHIQTEDSGRNSPTIVTLLYSGGTILASRKTSYADIARVDNLEQVVEELMKEQHKGMLRSLKNGEFDDVIARFRAGAPAVPAPASTQVRAAPVPAVPAAPPPTASPPVAVSSVASPAPVNKPKTVEAGLDDIILSYLMGEEK